MNKIVMANAINIMNHVRGVNLSSVISGPQLLQAGAAHAASAAKYIAPSQTTFPIAAAFRNPRPTLPRIVPPKDWLAVPTVIGLYTPAVAETGVEMVVTVPIATWAPACSRISFDASTATAAPWSSPPVPVDSFDTSLKKLLPTTSGMRPFERLVRDLVCARSAAHLFKLFEMSRRLSFGMVAEGAERGFVHSSERQNRRRATWGRRRHLRRVARRLR